jgi:hypothetical protein
MIEKANKREGIPETFTVWTSVLRCQNQLSYMVVGHSEWTQVEQIGLGKWELADRKNELSIHAQ